MIAGARRAAATAVVALLGWAAAPANAQSGSPTDPAVPGDAPADPRAATWAAVAQAGGAAAILPAECMPADPPLLLALTAAESPAERRDAAAFEVYAGLPGDAALAAAVAGDGGGAIAASLALLHAAQPSLPVPRWAGEGACDPAIAAAAAGWGLTSREDWLRTVDGIDALFAVATVPVRYLRRAAVHWYLDTRPSPIAHVAEQAEAAGTSPTDVAALRALAAGAADDPAAMAEAARAIGDDPDPYLLWVRAEAARQGGRTDLALELAGQALAADPYFFAAWLTRTSALVASGREDDALVDLEFLERAFDGVAVYAPWLERLAARLR